MSTEFNAVAVADPTYDYDGMERQAVDLAATHTTADGNLHLDYSGDTRVRFNLKWIGITAAQKAALWTIYQTRTAQSFKPPDTATTWSCFVVPNTWHESYIVAGDGNPRYQLEFSIEEID